MNIIALCKTFRGEEWLEPMARSIAPFVQKIVFVNSEISWSGRKGNTCKAEISRLLDSDIKDKIISLNYDTIDQFDQCMYGYTFIKRDFPSTDYVMLIDTDEVWDDIDMRRAIDFLSLYQGDVKAFRVRMYTYIKSPFWRVNPEEPLHPVCFVSTQLPDLGANGARSCEFPHITIPKIHLHHYVYVRKDFNTVLEKIITSHVSENTRYEDMAVWIPEVWNKLPHVKEGFHPAIGFKNNWQGLIQIERDQMPRVLRETNFPIIEKFLKKEKKIGK